MRFALILLLVGCAEVHGRENDAATAPDAFTVDVNIDAGRCLIDVPCWCVTHHPDGGAPYANCRHTEAECQELEQPGDDACSPAR